MKLKWVLFIFGLILFLVSIPVGGKMIAELAHSAVMDSRYDIENVNQGFPATPTDYQFKNEAIVLVEELSDEEPYVDPWDNQIGIGDIALEINGEEIDRLEGFPIRIHEEGLNRYWGEVTFLTVEYNKTDETTFHVLMKKSRDLIKETPDKSIVGLTPDEELLYTFYEIDADGNVAADNFKFTDRDALQTELLNKSYLYYHQLGYYTDAWQGYPSLIFPFVYPFFTLIAGIVCTIVFFPKKKGPR